jgi:ATP-binding cassette subfamily C protein LapB
MPRIEQLKNSIAQVNRLMNIAVERTPHVLKKPIDHLDGHIKLSNIGLRYNKDIEPVFVGLNLDVKAGEIIAITGGNGSGKTTILKLINGLYKPQAGNIRIDGIDIRQLEPIELRHYIAYLPQNPDFFEGTIRENLHLANPLCTDQDINNALEKANALDDVNDLENGLDTEICGNNFILPSGFAYRLNFARILLKDSNILLLDELPNASLNSSTGESYQNLIKESKGVRTVFFVTHRDDYLKMADKVIVLRAGKKPQILEPDEVINKYGDF